MKQQDPLALAVFGAALALLAGLLSYVFFLKTSEPEVPARSFDLAEALRRQVSALTATLVDKTATKPSPPAAKPARQAVKPEPAPVAGAPASPPQGLRAPAQALPAGNTWSYRVTVEPAIWRDGSLTYRTRQEDAGLGVLTSFVHAEGRMNFQLGVFAPGHPSHANMRFPGFFMYASYLQLPLEVGQPVVFSWPWQGAENRPGRIKRFECRVWAWEDLMLPAGKLHTARIAGTVAFLDEGKVQATALEAFWYSPQVAQVVRIERHGQTPDEKANRIVAELAEYRKD